MMISKNPLLVWFMLNCVVSSASAANDLNKVLNLVLSEMNSDGFFADTWSNFFGGTPIPVPSCTDEAEVVPADQADESIARVLEAGVVKVGVSPIAADMPSLFSTVGDPLELTANADELDGYYVNCMKEAVRRIGEKYEISLAPEVVLVEGEGFFEPLRDGLNNGIIDIAWSGITIREDRAAEVDFACPSFQADVVIGASSAAGTAVPPADGPNITVACTTFYCDMLVPPPFVLENLGEDMSVSDMNAVLLDTADSYEYAMATKKTETSVEDTDMDEENTPATNDEPADEDADMDEEDTPATNDEPADEPSDNATDSGANGKMVFTVFLTALLASFM